jgi:hypothetical protein
MIIFIIITIIITISQIDGEQRGGVGADTGDLGEDTDGLNGRSGVCVCVCACVCVCVCVVRVPVCLHMCVSMCMCVWL